MSQKITMTPIGYVQGQFSENTPSDTIRPTLSQIVIEPEYQAGLMGLQAQSDVQVLFYLADVDEARIELQLHRYHNPENPLQGVFATRTQFRPNQIGSTVAYIETIEGNVLHVTGLDALDGTPVLDLKPYQPHFDAEVKQPGAEVRQVASLEDARHVIDLIDTEVLRLLGKRAKYVHQVVRFKNNATEIRAQSRYDEVMRRRREMAEEVGLNPDVIEQMYVLLVENFIKEEMELLKAKQGKTE